MTYINSRGKMISITYYGAQRKMAREAMAQNNKARAAVHFKLIRKRPINDAS